MPVLSISAKYSLSQFAGFSLIVLINDLLYLIVFSPKNINQYYNIAYFITTINKNQHSIIIELESIEYSLLHDGEKSAVDRELISISKMLKFPIQFLEVKKQIELGEMIEEIKLNTLNSNLNVKEYANQLAAHLEELQEDQNLFERKNYMVISSFNNRKTAEMELKEFFHLLRYHLLNIKVSSRLLTDKEIVELIYEQLHKGNKNKVTDIEQEGGFALYVTGNNRKKN